jgi:hypothetical protein
LLFYSVFQSLSCVCFSYVLHNKVPSFSTMKQQLLHQLVGTWSQLSTRASECDDQMVGTHTLLFGKIFDFYIHTNSSNLSHALFLRTLVSCSFDKALQVPFISQCKFFPWGSKPTFPPYLSYYWTHCIVTVCFLNFPP